MQNQIIKACRKKGIFLSDPEVMNYFLKTNLRIGLLMILFTVSSFTEYLE